ncbi:MAG: diacylglycerol kinase family protein [Polyangiales bacterium]|nr:hypothetical protein [Myxococcales bacterium]MCB9658619.1 hypothetical protein [Sandaracinaceae bacterium]
MKPAIARVGEATLKQLESKRTLREGVRLRADIERRSGLQTPKIGVIYNPKSAANLGRSPLRAIGVACGQPTTRGELVSVLRGFADAEVNIVAVSGGDGTIREVLTAIPQAYGDLPHPAIAILAAGRTDLIAGEVGSSGRRDELARLLASAKAGELRRTRRPILRVEGVVDTDGVAVTPRGMLMGAAAFSYGTELCQTEVHADGASHATAVGITVARVVGRILFKGDPDGLLKGEPLGLSVDGKADDKGPDASRSLLLVSTLRERLVLGRTPFFGDYAEDQLQYVEVDAPAKGLTRALSSMVVRKPWLAGPGWNAGAAKTLDLGMQRSMIIDGEIFRPVDGRVRVTADPVVDFVAP